MSIYGLNEFLSSLRNYRKTFYVVEELFISVSDTILSICIGLDLSCGLSDKDWSFEFSIFLKWLPDFCWSWPYFVYLGPLPVCIVFALLPVEEAPYINCKTNFKCCGLDSFELAVDSVNLPGFPLRTHGSTSMDFYHKFLGIDMP